MALSQKAWGKKKKWETVLEKQNIYIFFLLFKITSSCFLSIFYEIHLYEDFLVSNNSTFVGIILESLTIILCKKVVYVFFFLSFC